MSTNLSELSLERSAFSVVALTTADDDERFFWLNKTIPERLQYIQLLRTINYGNAASARLQRVFEITQRATG